MKNFNYKTILFVALFWIALGCEEQDTDPQQLTIHTPLSSAASLNNVSNSFSMLNYNIAGINAEALAFFGIDRGTDPANDIPKIMDKINEVASWDMVFFQEDFEYHNKVRNNYNSSIYPFKGKNNVSKDIFGLITGNAYYKGDGLYRFAKDRFHKLDRDKFGDCNGDDCMAKKGFSYARHFLANNVIVDVYNIHAEAGRQAADLQIKRDGFNKMLDVIAERSKGHAVIIVGDVNSRFDRDGDDGVKILLDNGFTDVFYDVNNMNTYISPDSAAKAFGEGVEKYLFRSSSMVTLDPTAFIDESSVFSDGDDWSDHPPITANFNYSAVNSPIISLKGVKENKFLRAGNDGGGGNIKADQNSAGDFEKFILVHDGNDLSQIESGEEVYLMTYKGWYVNTDNNDKLRGEGHGRDEKFSRFTLINHTRSSGHIQDGDVISLQSVDTGNFVRHESNGGANCEGTNSSGDRMKFTVTIH